MIMIMDHYFLLDEIMIAIGGWLKNWETITSIYWIIFSVSIIVSVLYKVLSIDDHSFMFNILRILAGVQQTVIQYPKPGISMHLTYRCIERGG